LIFVFNKFIQQTSDWTDKCLKHNLSLSFMIHPNCECSCHRACDN
jgi:hypothetical protein